MKRKVRLFAIAAFVGAAACTSFSGSNDDTTTPASDGGADADAGFAPPPPPPADSGSDVASPLCGDPLPTPATFVSPAPPADALATDGAYVYWTSNAAKQMGRASISGGVPETILTGATGSLSRITFTNDDVLWKNADHLYYTAKTNIVDGGIADGSASYLNDAIGDVVALGASIVYVRGADGTYRGTPGGPFGIVMAPSTSRELSGVGTRVVFVAPDPDAGSASVYALDDVNVAATKPRLVVHDDGGAPAVLASDASNVFYATDAADAIYVVPVSGGGPSVVVSDQTGVSAIVLDGSDLFFASASGIARVAKTGGCVQPLAAAPVASSFVVVPPWVYAIAPGGIVRVPR